MRPHIKCPECQKEFSIKKHLKSGVRPELSSIKYVLRNIAFPWIDGLEGVYNPNLVVCPQCGNEFNSKGYKFFGFIEAKHFKIGLAVVVILFLFAFIAGMIWSALKIM